MDLKLFIREIIKEEFETTPVKTKTQRQFNWQEDYPDYLKSDLEIKGNNVILYHYGSDEGTGYLNPEFFGKHSYTSDIKQWSQKRLMFYVHKEDKEERVSGNEYIIQYPLNKLYPFNSDPFYFYEECLEEINLTALPINKQISCIGNKVRKAGFDGMIMKWGNSYRVDIWKSVKI